MCQLSAKGTAKPVDHLIWLSNWWQFERSIPLWYYRHTCMRVYRPWTIIIYSILDIFLLYVYVCTDTGLLQLWYMSTCMYHVYTGTGLLQLWYMSTCMYHVFTGTGLLQLWYMSLIVTCIIYTGRHWPTPALSFIGRHVSCVHRHWPTYSSIMSLIVTCIHTCVYVVVTCYLYVFDTHAVIIILILAITVGRMNI